MYLNLHYEHILCVTDTLILLFHLQFGIKAGFFALFDGRIFYVFLHDKDYGFCLVPPDTKNVSHYQWAK